MILDNLIFKIKYLVPCVCAVLSLSFVVSCNRSKMVEPMAGRAIEISPTVLSYGSNVQGRVTDNAFENGDQIGVYVSKYNTGISSPLLGSGNYAGRGDNGCFTRTNGGWLSSPVMCWMPGNADKIDVYGYYPYNPNVGNALAVELKVAEDQNLAAAYQASDFMYAKSSEVEYGTAVSDNFVFTHKLAKVIVTLSEGEMISREQLMRATITLGGTRLQSSINLGDGTLTPVSGDIQDINMRKNGLIFDAIVIPQSINNRELFVIDIDGEKFTFNSSFNFAENSSHSFSIKVSKSGLSVTSNSITGWVDDPNPSTGDATGNNPSYVAPYMTASFIQSWLIIGWDDQRWEDELTLLKSVGIKDLIVDQSLWYYAEGSKYLSLIPITNAELGLAENIVVEFGNALERMLIACKRNDMGVYVGLNYDTRYWFKMDLNRQIMLRQAEMGNAVMSKVMSLYGDQYAETIKGWYWSWEIDNVNLVETEVRPNQTLLGDMMAINVDHRNSHVELNRPILMSPFMNPQGGGMSSAEYRQMWVELFHKVDMRSGDVMTPQDCMGTGYLNTQTAMLWLSDLKMATATKPGMEFWVNTEIFTPAFQPAPVSELIKRLQFDSKLGSRLVCFAYSHYYSPLLDPAFQSFHDQYLQYYESLQ